MLLEDARAKGSLSFNFPLKMSLSDNLIALHTWNTHLTL